MKKLVPALVLIAAAVGLLFYIANQRNTSPASAAPKRTTTAPATSDSVVTDAPSHPEPVLAAADQISTRDAASPESPAAPTPEEPATRSAGTVTPEVLGTVRMIAAHAPLRVPEVADPDSASNKEILNTMVSKALEATSDRN